MLKNIHIQYVTDEKGNKTAVLIPLEEWQKIRQELAAFIEYRSLKKKLKSAFKEVTEIQNGEKAKINLNDFLNES